MLGLDRGHACHGMVLQIEAHKVRDELRVLWRREALTQVCEPDRSRRWWTARP